MKKSLPESDHALPPLSFPILSPQTGTALVDVGPGVKLLRMPMPWALDHVNLYLLQGEAGWVIVDTGMNTPEARNTWDDVFNGPLAGERIAAVLCTHFHADHVGLAGYLADRWQAPLLMSHGEYFTQRGWPLELAEVPWQHAGFYRQAGYPEELLQQTLVMFRFSKLMLPLPPAFSRLRDGGRIPFAAGDWQVIIGSGHSPEHVLLYSPERAMLISGDQLLPRITTNVSVSAVDPDDEPLSRWLASLDRLAELPDDLLVLPAHGLPFCGIRSRVAELRTHHDHQLKKVLDDCGARPASAFELAQAMFPMPLSDFNLVLALGECLAHIRYLLSRGRLEGFLDEMGVMRYRSLAGVQDS